ncbi:F-box/FBD/LRR-repeat protein At1g13570-like isoform X2 [Daucus carota subsp. sativus]|uniref:F-box/FBD/LRR-repeat protein At1g13570-like isoform X2 n=1 Tax=Daucus carota subsp. sativus TaxID=79200 RepID=UPI0007EF61CC|nr:PREDICTED: F-box/FBD/LRR-repeat protein At1g13570-like isoform X3 [Daucus carota subsp. sativus]
MASDAKTRRLDCGDGIDRISNLPGNVIDLILKRLPLHGAARMSVLSKAWRDIWVMFPRLVFDDDFFEQLSLARAFKKDEGTRLSQFSRTISEMTHLSLTGCVLKPPPKYKGFSNLICVSLVHVVITTDMSFGAQLVELYMECCHGTEYLGRQFKYYNNLTELSIRECGEVELQWFESIQKVKHLCLMLDGKANKVINFADLVDKMPRIQTIHLDNFFLESLELGAAVTKRNLMENLRDLYFYNVESCNLVQIQKVLCLIRISPNLQYLHMALGRNVMNVAESTKLMVSSVVQYLQSPELMDMNLNQLEAVEIKWIDGTDELQFIKLLLASSPSLRWMKLFHIAINDSKEQLRISRELMRFRRASTAAEIIWT